MFDSIFCGHKAIGWPRVKFAAMPTGSCKAYRRCNDCGAARDFDLDTWKFVGPWYLETPESRPSPAGQSREAQES